MPFPFAWAQAGLCLGGILLFEGQAAGQGSLFVYSRDGAAPASWNDVRNWSQDGNPPPAARVPGTDPADRVTIGLDSLSGVGDWQLKDLTLGTVYGPTITGGTFSISESLIMSGGATLNACSVKILGGAKLSFINPLSLNFGFNSVLLENDGTIHLDPGDFMGLGTFAGPGNGTVINNFGTIELNDSTSITSVGPASGTTLNNDGLIIKQATTSATGMAGLTMNYFYNTSSAYVQSAGGILLVAPTVAGTNYGQFVAAAAGTNSVVEILNLTLVAGTVGQGPGRIEVGAGLADYLAGDTVIENLDLTGGVILGPGMLTLKGTCSLTTGVIEGIVSGGALVDTSPSCIISTGAVVSATGGPGGCDLARNFVNHGDLILTSTIATAPGTTTLTSVHFTNEVDGLMDLQASGGLGGAAPLLCNQGTLLCASNGQESVLVTVVNQGDAELPGGTTAPATWTQTSGRTHLATGAILQCSVPMNFPGGLIEGFGSLNAFGGVNVGGTISPGASPGTLTFGGFGGGLSEQPPNAALAIEIGGYVPGVDFDHVIVSQQAGLAGALIVSFINGFLPVLGDSFEILHCNSRTKTFSSVSGARAGNGLVLVPRYSSTNVVLVAANDLSLISPVRTASQFQFSFPSTSGFNYIVEYADSLTPPINWQPLGFVLPGTGGLIPVIDPAPPPTERFYRVVFQ